MGTWSPYARPAWPDHSPEARREHALCRAVQIANRQRQRSARGSTSATAWPSVSPAARGISPGRRPAGSEDQGCERKPEEREQDHEQLSQHRRASSTLLLKVGFEALQGRLNSPPGDTPAGGENEEGRAGWRLTLSLRREGAAPRPGA